MKNKIVVPRFTNFNTDEKASRILSKIKSKNTSPEVLLSKALWAAGVRYRKHYNKLPGKPDLVLVSKKIAIFIDGDFWHGRNWEAKKQTIKRNREYWIPKIERNIQRDQEQERELQRLGWKVIRVWESDIKKSLLDCIKELTKEIMLSSKQ